MKKTSCPQCQTILHFKLEQLAQRNGMVRCGVCRHVFNALEHIYDEDDFPILEQVEPSPTESSANHQGSQGDDYYIGDISHQSHNTVDYHTNRASTQATITARTSLDDEFTIREDSSYDDNYEYEEENSSASTSTIWIWLTLLALIVAAIQIAYVFRNQISNAVPSTRPYLIQLCSVLKCEVGIIKSEQNIGVENHVLVVDKALKVQKGEQALRLQFQLVNKTNLPQEWPVLALQLKNAQGSIMSSRNISPKEYLVAEQVMRPLPAEARQIIDLPFVLSGDTVSSYELRVFYP